MRHSSLALISALVFATTISWGQQPVPKAVIKPAPIFITPGTPVPIDEPAPPRMEELTPPAANAPAHRAIRLIDWCPRNKTILKQTANESDVDFAKRYALAQQMSWPDCLETLRSTRASLAAKPQSQKEYEMERTQTWLKQEQEDAAKLELQVAYWESEMRNNPKSLVAPSAYRGYVNALNTVRSHTRVLETHLRQIER